MGCLTAAMLKSPTTFVRERIGPLGLVAKRVDIGTPQGAQTARCAASTCPPIEFPTQGLAAR